MRTAIAALTTSALIACGGGGDADPLAGLRRDILDLNGHVIVMKETNSFVEYRDVIATAAREPGVVSGLPFVFVELKATLRGRTEVASLKGIALDRTPLGQHLTPPNVLDGHRPIAPDAAPGDPDAIDRAPDDLAEPPAPPTDFTATAGAAPPPAPELHVVIGVGLARALDARIGDVLALELAPAVDLDTWRTPDPPPPRRARIVGTFTLREYDQQLLLTTFEAAQELVGRGDQVLGIELRLTRAADAAAVARTLTEKLGPRYHIVDWCELNRAVLRC